MIAKHFEGNTFSESVSSVSQVMQYCLQTKTAESANHIAAIKCFNSYLYQSVSFPTVLMPD